MCDFGQALHIVYSPRSYLIFQLDLRRTAVVAKDVKYVATELKSNRSSLNHSQR
jgi:hypothetical protein